MKPTASNLTVALAAAAVLILGSCGVKAQPGPGPSGAEGVPPAVSGMERGNGVYSFAEGQDKPDQKLYKEGYNLILDEQWAPARRKFTELLQKYPSTGYSDDASYWSAYALMHTDAKKALAAYKEFVAKHPRSSYYSDAVADMTGVQAQLEAQKAQAEALRQGLDTLRFAIPAPPPHLGVIPDMREFKMSMRQLQRNLSGMRFNVRSPWSRGFGRFGQEDTLDEGTRLKLEAISALGEGKEDEKAFQTLKAVALDMHEPLPLRQEALDQLSGFKNFDPASVYLEIAKSDTSEEVQGRAIDNYRESMKDKNRAVSDLSSLFNAVPRSRADQRAMIVYEIAEIGNDRAIDFLSNVAKNDRDYGLRSDAVYYLGNIGGDKARGALYEILKTK